MAGSTIGDRKLYRTVISDIPFMLEAICDLVNSSLSTGVRAVSYGLVASRALRTGYVTHRHAVLKIFRETAGADKAPQS